VGLLVCVCVSVGTNGYSWRCGLARRCSRTAPCTCTCTSPKADSIPTQSGRDSIADWPQFTHREVSKCTQTQVCTHTRKSIQQASIAIWTVGIFSMFSVLNKFKRRKFMKTKNLLTGETEADPEVIKVCLVFDLHFHLGPLADQMSTFGERVELRGIQILFCCKTATARLRISTCQILTAKLAYRLFRFPCGEIGGFRSVTLYEGKNHCRVRV